MGSSFSGFMILIIERPFEISKLIEKEVSKDIKQIKGMANSSAGGTFAKGIVVSCCQLIRSNLISAYLARRE